MMTSSALFVLCFHLGITLVHAYIDDVVDYNNYKVLRLTPSTQEEVEFLRKLEDDLSVDLKLDFWSTITHAGDPINIGIPNENVAALEKVLKNQNISHTLLVEDMQLIIDNEKRDNPPQFLGFSSTRAFALDQYHPLAEITSYIKQLPTDYPNLVKVQLLGHTSENREINGVKIGLGDSTNKPIFYIDAGIHAREWIAPATALYIINELVTKATSDVKINNLLKKFDFFVIPVVNADGYSYTWTSNRAWRKNRSRPQPFSGCYGVDPNRNFPLGFGGASTSQNPCSDLYTGINAFSESESRAIQKFTEANSQRIRAVITLHSFGQMWMSPWGYISQKPTDYDKMMTGARTAQKALSSHAGTSYKIGSIYEVIYPAGGGSIDWQYQVVNSPYVYAVELRDTGFYGFQLPKQLITPTATETWLGISALAAII